MKKAAVLLAIIALAFLLTACGKKDESEKIDSDHSDEILEQIFEWAGGLDSPILNIRMDESDKNHYTLVVFDSWYDDSLENRQNLADEWLGKIRDMHKQFYESADISLTVVDGKDNVLGSCDAGAETVTLDDTVQKPEVDPLEEQKKKEAEARNAKFMEVVTQARDASETATAEQCQEAYNFIYNIVMTDYMGLYADDATMEQGMYYGSLLDYCYEKSNPLLAQIGMNTVQAIKYVYRNEEAVDDESTLINIEEIKKGIDKFQHG